MNLTLPKAMQDRILKEISSLPAIHGKVVLQFSFNFTMQKSVASMKVLRSIEEEIRPC